MRVAINLSVHQLRQPDLAERIAAALKRHQINPQPADLRDHAGSAAMEDAEGTQAILERLAAVGVHLSIDDFGTGFCNFAMLRKCRPGAERSTAASCSTSGPAPTRAGWSTR